MVMSSLLCPFPNAVLPLVMFWGGGVPCALLTWWLLAWCSGDAQLLCICSSLIAAEMTLGRGCSAEGWDTLALYNQAGVDGASGTSGSRGAQLFGPSQGQSEQPRNADVSLQ